MECCRTEARAEKESKLKIKMNKSKHKLQYSKQKLENGPFSSAVSIVTKTDKLLDAIYKAMKTIATSKVVVTKHKASCGMQQE